MMICEPSAPVGSVGSPHFLSILTVVAWTFSACVGGGGTETDATGSSSSTSTGAETSSEAASGTETGTSGTETDTTSTSGTEMGTETGMTGTETSMTGASGTSGTSGMSGMTGPTDTEGELGGCSSDKPVPGLWCPVPGVSWQWQIDGEAIDTAIDVDMYDVDLFEVSDAELSTLKTDGRVVICYFSAGSYEEWRPDAADFPEEALGTPLEGWPGERWLDIRDPGVREIQAARLDLAQARGCDGVEPDNVDGYANNNGLGLTGGDQLDYNLWLAAQAHVRGLSVGLKNDLDQIDALVFAFDWALNEECAAYNECELLTPFIDAGKAVFNVAYVDDIADGPALAEEVCAAALGLGFSTLIKEWDLGPWRIAC